MEVRRIMFRTLLAAVCCLALELLPASLAAAADWPMWRYDASRSAASPHDLPDELALQWVRILPPLEPAWPDQPKLQFDTAYQPIVVGQLVLVGSPSHDTLHAYDAASGEEVWTFFAEGPIRFAPAAAEGRVYVGSDDGHLYCLDARTGQELWRFRGGPARRRVLGNQRLIATWPVRGAPVVHEGTVYFAAGIWPFMGIFLHALDAETGRVRWTNDGDGSIYIKQPHSADAFAGVAPQGPLALHGDKLLVPGGRSVPACFDTASGQLKYYLLNENSKRGGGFAAAANRKFLFNGGAVFDLETEKHLGTLSEVFVADDRTIFACSSRKCTAYDAHASTIERVKMVDRRGKIIEMARWTLVPLATASTNESATALIRAGKRLYSGGAGWVGAADLPLDEDKPFFAWRAEIEGTVAGLAAGADRLVVSTREGRLYVFGPGPATQRVHRLPQQDLALTDGDWQPRAAALLEGIGHQDPYAVIWGAGSGELVRQLAAHSALRLIVVEPDGQRAIALRRELMAAGIPGRRVAVCRGQAESFELPPYLAERMAAETLPVAEGQLPDFVARAFESLRPYGGRLALPLSQEQTQRCQQALASRRLPGLAVQHDGTWAWFIRRGALPGAADWTHQHADAANTRVSRDQRVKAPLGLLWFGGSTHDEILPRHGHGPQPQVIEGRAIVEGPDLLRAVDIYTGRVLWERRLPGIGRFYNNTGHQPGANAAGTNYISTTDGIYVAYRDACLKLDPDTGETIQSFQLPAAPGQSKPPRWGYLNVVGDLLIGGADPLGVERLAQQQSAGQRLLAAATKASPKDDDLLSASLRLVVLDRHTGQVRWQIEARHGFRHNGVCAGGGRLYCIDRPSGMLLARLKRRGEQPRDPARLLVLDLETGREIWSTDEDVFGTWLSYSEEHDVLVEAGMRTRDTLSDEAAGMRAWQAGDGRVLWNERYNGPAILHHRRVLTGDTACDLLTGEEWQSRDPLTGRLIPWQWTRTYGCNTPAASEHLLLFRSGAAGFYDLAGESGTGNLGGFRSSCTNNLIVAGGVLCAPEFTRTCTCSYQNQSSIGLVHDPAVERWSYLARWQPAGPIRQMGMNLNAPGDRRAEDGTLWLEFPFVAGPAPSIDYEIRPEKCAAFRRHESHLEGELAWVAASGLEGIESLSVELGKTDTPRSYTLRLFFAEPRDIAPGERRFDVSVQGQAVLNDFDVLDQAGRPWRSVVKTVESVAVEDVLTIELKPAKGSRYAPILCGVEIMAAP